MKETQKAIICISLKFPVDDMLLKVNILKKNKRKKTTNLKKM